MSETNALTELYDIQDLQATTEGKISTWLCKRGWYWTCQTPGSRWMWRKDWDGKTFLVTQSTAVDIQEIWDTDQYAKDFPEAVNE